MIITVNVMTAVLVGLSLPVPKILGNGLSCSEQSTYAAMRRCLLPQPISASLAQPKPWVRDC